MDTGAPRREAKTLGAKARPIELKIHDIGQLFQSLDPLPFRERDLDIAVEDYVVSWARELPRRKGLEIVVHLPAAQMQQEDSAQVAQAILNYFAYRADQVTRELAELFRFGRTALIIGVTVLALCVIAGIGFSRLLNNDYIGRFLQEGLFILGWVANWRPMEVFLYDWWPLARRRRLYRRLASANVTLTPTDAG